MQIVKRDERKTFFRIHEEENFNVKFHVRPKIKLDNEPMSVLCIKLGIREEHSSRLREKNANLRVV